MVCRWRWQRPRHVCRGDRASRWSFRYNAPPCRQL